MGSVIRNIWGLLPYAENDTTSELESSQ